MGLEPGQQGVESFSTVGHGCQAFDTCSTNEFIIRIKRDQAISQINDCALVRTVVRQRSKHFKVGARHGTHEVQARRSGIEVAFGLQAGRYEGNRARIQGHAAVDRREARQVARQDALSRRSDGNSQPEQLKRFGDDPGIPLQPQHRLPHQLSPGIGLPGICCVRRGDQCQVGTDVRQQRNDLLPFCG